MQPKDSQGNPVAVGDMVIVRGHVVAIPVPPSADMPAVLQIQWESEAPLLDFVKSTIVEKEPSDYGISRLE